MRSRRNLGFAWDGGNWEKKNDVAVGAHIQTCVYYVQLGNRQVGQDTLVPETLPLSWPASSKTVGI